MDTPRRILFFCEAVTLAHVARAIVLGEALARGHQVTLAVSPHATRFLPAGDLPFRVEALHSIPGSQFIDALARGKPLYEEAELLRYVEDDLRLVDATRPDLVVGDFRISLSVSARLRGVPYLNVANAYWSPWYQRAPLLPVLPWTRYVPLPIGRAAFALAHRRAMAAHTVPLNRVRKRFGLSSLGDDLRQVYTDADYVAYADVPELFPTHGAPSTHRYIGPVLWSPPGEPPPWWNEPDTGQLAYVTMGSSGDPALLGSIVSALDALGVRSLVASVDARFSPPAGSLARVAGFLPGVEAARRADLVVCNGGSLSTQQGLAAGKPVLGVASNMDQFLNMRAITEAGAGCTVRADRASPRAIGAAARALLGSTTFRDAARRLSVVLARLSAPEIMCATVAGILGAGTAGGPHREKDPTKPDSGVPGSARAGLHAGLGNEPPRA